MSPTYHKKICWSCEADVGLHATVCPFCGADLSSETSYNPPNNASKLLLSPPADSVSSLYKPPYSIHGNLTLTHSHEFQENAVDEENGNEEERQTVDMFSTSWPILLLSIGAQLLVLGIMMLIFGKNGTLTLQWNARYWFVFCFFSFIPLYFGGRMLISGSSQKDRENG